MFAAFRDEMHRLVELAADDVASRRFGRLTIALALVELNEDRGVFGPCPTPHAQVPQRVHRLLTPAPRLTAGPPAAADGGGGAGAGGSAAGGVRAGAAGAGIAPSHRWPRRRSARIAPCTPRAVDSPPHAAAPPRPPSAPSARAARRPLAVLLMALVAAALVAR